MKYVIGLQSFLAIFTNLLPFLIIQAENLVVGDYSVIVTDENLCQNTQLITVVEPRK